MSIKSLLVSLALGGSSLAATQVASADTYHRDARVENKVRAEEHREIRNDQREIRNDRREIRTERRDERLELKDRRLHERERLERIRIERLERAKRGC